MRKKILFLKNISKIGATVFWKIALVAGLICFYALSKFTQKRIRYTVCITCNGRSLRVLFSHFMDFIVAYEVFVLEQYKNLTGHPEVSCVLDLGANVGFSTLYLTAYYPQARIVAVEPDENTFSFLKENTRLFPNIVCVRAAVTNHDGVTTFYVHPKSSISSSLVNRDDTYMLKTVPAVTLKGLIHTHVCSLDVLKFDIEGAESVLFGNSESVPPFRYIVGEYHADIVGKPVESFITSFKAHKVSVFPVSKNRYIVSAEHNNA